MGKYRSVEQIPMMKWSLNVLIALSATLRQFITEGASCKSMSLDLSSLWNSVEASLLILVYAGLIPLVSR